MYSILPASVSLFFLAYGVYVLRSRGSGGLAATFLAACITTFCWQFTWAMLFYVNDPQLGLLLAKLGYLFILFLPTTVYHLVCKLTRRQSEQRRVYASYAVAAVLALLLFSSELVVAGLYAYFFGFYPKAGILHCVHVLQTALVMLRALFMLYRAQREAVAVERLRLRYCLLSITVYFFAAVDYVCNYGVEFYPPGVLFLALSLALIAQPVVRHNLLFNSMSAAASIAHEMRTPLATIRNQARGLAKNLPELIAGYRYATEQRDFRPGLGARHLAYLSELAHDIETEVARSNFIVDMVLASVGIEALQKKDFALHSVKKCVDEALMRYPFDAAARAKVQLPVAQDFSFHGSDVLLIYVLYNLFKNALHAIERGGRGHIEIAFFRENERNCLLVSDDGAGIPAHVLPHVFEPFFSTRRGGSGLGLTFCQRVVNAFGGKISCESCEGRYTTFMLEFPLADAAAGQAA